jgi:hypothetical protein
MRFVNIFNWLRMFHFLITACYFFFEGSSKKLSSWPFLRFKLREHPFTAKVHFEGPNLRKVDNLAATSIVNARKAVGRLLEEIFRHWSFPHLISMLS